MSKYEWDVNNFRNSYSDILKLDAEEMRKHLLGDWDLTPDPHHFNSKSFYPPVDTWIVIDTPEGYHKVKRPDSYVTQTEDMIYLTKEGNEIKGRYPWRYD